MEKDQNMQDILCGQEDFQGITPRGEEAIKIFKNCKKIQDISYNFSK